MKKKQEPITFEEFVKQLTGVKDMKELPGWEVWRSRETKEAL